MGERTAENIFLIGFSYSGKSSVGRAVAQKLGWGFADTDDEIEAIAGKTIPEIFSNDGEPHFRKLESQALASLCRKKGMVISTGGGIIVAADNRQLMKKSGAVICLEAEVETIYRRLLADSLRDEGAVARPLLAGADPKGRITSLKESRQQYYAEADWTVHTDRLAVVEVANEVIRGWRYLGGDRRYSDPEAAAVVTTATESYPIIVGWGLLGELGPRMKRVGLAGNAHVISDDRVFPLLGERTMRSISDAGLGVDSFVVPHGEKSKSLEMASRIYDFLLDRRAERGHAIVALGGGMVGDLAGFVAATLLRGMPLVQVPTSLMAMVDSSIGGKVAVNHLSGKNLIGAFHQPRLVLADVQTLESLPAREVTSGWAEVVKHGLIRDAEYFDSLERNIAKLRGLEQEATTEAIRRSVAIKASVVSEDEKEAGLRTILNYGHTIAHGIEAAAGYERMLHGEAVSVGMMGAAMIARGLGLLGTTDVERQRALLAGLGLPTTASGVDVDAIWQAMTLDKKVREGNIRWVLLERIGDAAVREDVPRDIVRTVLHSLVVK